MGKLLVKIFIIGLLAAFILSGAGLCRIKGGNLYDELSSKDEVKTYVAKIKDLTGEKKADLVSLSKVLENALATRMTINFKLVPDIKDADIAVFCDVTEYIYTDPGPHRQHNGYWRNNHGCHYQ